MGRPPEPLPEEWAKVLRKAGHVTEEGEPSLKALAEAAGITTAMAWRTVYNRTTTGAVSKATVGKLSEALNLDTREVQALIAPGVRTKVALTQAELDLVERYRSMTDDGRAALDRLMSSDTTRRAG